MVSITGAGSVDEPFPDGRPLLTTGVTHRAAADVLRVAGEVDVSNADQLGTAIVDVLATVRPGRRVVVLDLDRVTFFAAAGLHVLNEAHQGCGDELELRLVTTSDMVLRVLRLFYLDREPPTYPDLEGACTP